MLKLAYVTQFRLALTIAPKVAAGKNTGQTDHRRHR